MDRDLKLNEAVEEYNSVTREKLTYEDLVKLQIYLQSVPAQIRSGKQKIAELAESLATVSSRTVELTEAIKEDVKSKHSVNPNQRAYKNRRKW